MKQLLLIAISFCLLAACKKKDDNNNGKLNGIDSTSSNYISNPTDYVLKKVRCFNQYVPVQPSGEIYSYIYNNDHLVSRIEWTQWQVDSTHIFGLGYDSFNYVNNRCLNVYCTARDYPYRSSYAYTYNSKGRPDLCYCLRQPGTIDSISFIYTPWGQLVNTLDWQINDNDRYNNTYAFDAHDDLYMQTEYLLNTLVAPSQRRTTWPAYDNKVNFLRTINGIPSNFYWHYAYFMFSPMSPNNAVKQTTYSEVPLGNAFADSVQTNYVYQYDSNGLPTKLTYGQLIVQFEYEKFR